MWRVHLKMYLRRRLCRRCFISVFYFERTFVWHSEFDECVWYCHCNVSHCALCTMDATCVWRDIANELQCLEWFPYYYFLEAHVSCDWSFFKARMHSSLSSFSFQSHSFDDFLFPFICFSFCAVDWMTNRSSISAIILKTTTKSSYKS